MAAKKPNPFAKAAAGKMAPPFGKKMDAKGMEMMMKKKAKKK